MHKFGCKNYNNKIGILLAQLGTPDAPTAKALRPYLKEFLGDRRVIEKPRWLWWLILNGIILNVRPKRSAALYKRIWTEQGSPLLVHTKNLTAKLDQVLKDRLDNIEITYGMRYGTRSIEEGVQELVDKDCQRILLFNMYPHYSATTVGTNIDAFFDSLKKYRWVPGVKVVEPYYNHPAYINALSVVINEAYQDYEKRPDKLVLSYHGIPINYVQKGDPYCCQCNVTTYCLNDALDFAQDEIIHTFQSRFGRDPWLQPYTDEVINSLPGKGIKDIAVFCPGFTADCLETLDEIGNEAREEFQEHGGENLRLIPCFNDHDVWVDAMKEMIIAELDTWLSQDQHENYSGFDCCFGLNRCKDPNFKQCGKCDCATSLELIQSKS